MHSKTYAAFIAAVATAAMALPSAAIAHPTSASMVWRTFNEFQLIEVKATGGTFLPTATAAPVAFNATAAQVDTSLEAVPAIGTGGVAVTGPDGGPYVVEFTGSNGAQDTADLAPDGAALTGTGAAATLIPRFTGDPATPTVGTRYIFSNHGYVRVYTETNADTAGGGFAYSALPSLLRVGTTANRLDVAQGLAGVDTGVQVHATCTVASLNADAAIADWQDVGGPNSDPFWNYVPFQSMSAGQDDDPADWIPVVQAATGVNLTGMSGAEAALACEEGLSGTYVPADVPSGAFGALSTGTTATAVADANAAKDVVIAARDATIVARDATIATKTSEMTTLQGKLSSLQAAKAAVDSARATADARVKELEDAPAATRALALSMAGRSLSLADGRGAVVSGEKGTKAVVQLRVSAAVRRSLGLSSPVLAMSRVTLDKNGVAIVDLQAGRAVTRAMNSGRVAVAAMLMVSAGSDTDSVNISVRR